MRTPCTTLDDIQVPITWQDTQWNPPSRQFKRLDIPDPKKVSRIYHHNLIGLIEAANLKVRFDNEVQNNRAFAANWGSVQSWTEAARYNPSIKKLDARDIIAGIEDPADGVLQWLTRHW